MRARKLSTTAIVLILICLAGLGLRAVKVVEPNAVPGDDARAYYALATSLYEDGTFGGPDFNNASDWSPGAPLLYAGLFHVTGGPREGSIRALEALLGLASILVIFALGRRLGRPRHGDAVGLTAAAGFALYPPFIHATGTTMSEPVALLLLPSTVLAFLWAREKGSVAAWAAPGLLAGLLALTRPEYLVVGAALALVAAWAVAPRGMLRGVLTGALFLAAMAAPILPWTVHNLNTLDRLVPISTGSGKALFTGTFMPGDGDYQRTKAILAERQLGVSLEPGSEALDAVAPRPLFDRVAARHPELDRDAALAKIGRTQLEEGLAERPLDYAAMTVRKVWRMWSNGQGALMSSIPGRAVQVALVLLGLAGLALLALRRRALEAVLYGMPVAAITAVGAITLASDRRAQILMSILLPLGALAAVALTERLRSYSQRP